MSLNVLSYNALRSFGDPARRSELIDFVGTLSPDVAFFPEAFAEDGDRDIVQESIADLEEMGYRVTCSDSREAINRTDMAGFFGIVKEQYAEGRVMNTAVRLGFAAKVTDPESKKIVSVGGAHLSDLDEELRLTQVRMLPKLDVFMGDLNAMHRKAPQAIALRALRPVTELLPEINTDFRITTKPLSRAISLGQRLTRMADGRTMLALEEKGLVDVDPSHQPTIHGVVQLDHIVVRPGITASNFKVHRDIKLSDHKPISVELHFGEDFSSVLNEEIHEKA